jgi:DnaJ-domain-containing protein 1
MTENPIARMQRRIIEVIQQEIGLAIDALLKDALSIFSVERLMQLLRSTGLDMSQLPGMMGTRPGFDPYMVLGLDRSASDEEVKKRYHELLKKLHPDKSGTPGTSFLFQMVVAAYELIKKERGWN